MRTAEGREDFRRYWDSAVDIPGPAAQRMADVARANQIELGSGR